MPNNKEIRVLQAYVDYLNGILNQTITDSRLVIITRADCLIISRYQDDNFLPLELTSSGYLHFRQLACVKAGKVIVEDCRYIYSLSADLDNEQDWIFRYEYCLKPEPNVPCAHIHINGTFQNQPIRQIHFPTGRVSLEQIIAHLITEHRVIPKTSGWFKLLKESHKGFTERRSDLAAPLFP